MSITNKQKIFILDSEEAFKQAESFKAELENQGFKVNTTPYVLINGVRITGIDEGVISKGGC